MIKFLMVNPKDEIEIIEQYLDSINLSLQLDKNNLQESSIYEKEEGLYRIKLKCIEGNNYFLELKVQTFNGSKHLFVDIEPQKVLSSFDKGLYNIKFVIKNLLKNDWKECIWLSDTQSSDYANKLYLDIHTVENKLRQFISLVMINHLGVKWWDNYTPKKVKDKYLARQGAYKRVAESYANVSDKLLSIDTDDLIAIMTHEIKTLKTTSSKSIFNLIDSLKETGDIRTVAAEYQKFVENIKKECEVEFNIWNEIFSKYISEEFIKQWADFSKNRNHIAHNKLIDTQAYRTIKKSIENVEKLITLAEQNFNSSVLSDEEKEKIMELQEVLEHEASLAEIDIMEAETGVTIRSIENIEEIFDEKIMEFLADLMDSIYFRSDLNVISKEFSEIESSESLLEVTSNLNEEKLTVDIIKEIYDDPGAESTVFIKLLNNSEVIEEAQVVYRNGEASFEEDLGYYMPVHQDEVYTVQLEEFYEKFNKEIDKEFPNLVELAKQEKYSSVKDGGPYPVGDFPCEECEEEYVCINELIAEIGVCLSCGHKHSIEECSKCENYYNEAMEGNDMFCDSCLDWMESQ